MSNRPGNGPNAQTEKPPDKITCYGCNKEKQAHSFSKTQLAKYMSNYHNPYAPKGRTTKKHHIMCKQCTPQQNNSLTCMICTRTKSLDQFAKAQRKNAEKARCLECMKKREDDDVDDSEPDTASDGSFNETWDDIL